MKKFLFTLFGALLLSLLSLLVIVFGVKAKDISEAFIIPISVGEIQFYGFVINTDGEEIRWTFDGEDYILFNHTDGQLQLLDTSTVSTTTTLEVDGINIPVETLNAFDFPIIETDENDSDGDGTNEYQYNFYIEYSETVCIEIRDYVNRNLISVECFGTIEPKSVYENEINTLRRYRVKAIADGEEIHPFQFATGENGSIRLDENIFLPMIGS